MPLTRARQENEELRQRLAEVEVQANAELAILQARVNKMDPVTSKFPVEITTYIFELYVSMHPSRRWFWPTKGITSFSPVQRSAPLRLGAVCENWRNVAWSLPQLWTTLIIDISDKGYALGPELVSQWLGRAGNLPLNICFSNVDVDSWVIGDSVYLYGKEVMRVINRHSAQWKCLDFTTLPLSILSGLDDSRYTNTATPSLLDYLAIGGNQDENLDPFSSESNTGIFETSQRKHSPTVLHFRSCITPSRIKVDWTRIVELRAERLSTRTLSDLMPYATLGRVERLTLHIERSWNDWSSPPVFEFPLLRCLEITDREAAQDVHITLLGSLVLPSLDCLRYTYNDWGTNAEELPINSIVSLTRRSSCTIRQLQLTDCIISNENLIQLLRSLPSLHTLDIRFHHSNYDGTDLVEHLSQARLRTDLAPFLPSLQSLIIQASPPQFWESLIGIYDESPSIIAKATLPISEWPLRKHLGIMFKLDDFQERGLDAYIMNALELQKIVALWCDYGILCVMRHWRPDDRSFLWQSFEACFPGYLDGDNESDLDSDDEEYGAEEQDDEQGEDEGDADKGHNKAHSVDIDRLYAGLSAMPIGSISEREADF